MRRGAERDGRLILAGPAAFDHGAGRFSYFPNFLLDLFLIFRNDALPSPASLSGRTGQAACNISS
jgi:hypothetical protein